MNKLHCFHFSSILVLLVAVVGAFAIASPADSGTAARLRVVKPVETQLGTVFTDDTGSNLYLMRGDTTEVILSAPGCGTYFTLSPDRYTVGFKEIFSDGTQAPALLDLRTAQVSLLHSPVSQCGQVAFSHTGAIAFSAGDSVFVQNGTSYSGFSIGTYSNIVVISADGSRIAYTDGWGIVHVRDLRTGSTDAVSGAGCMLPLWSPAGQKLCFSDLSGHVFVFDAGAARTFSLGEGFNPAWTSDGNSLIVVRKVIQHDSLTNSDLYEVSGDGAKTVRLTSTPEVCESDPSVGQNGSIVFGDYRGSDLFTGTIGRSFTINSVVEVDRAKIASAETEYETKEKLESAFPQGTPAAVHFEVPYTNQVWDTPYGFGSLGSSACGPTTAIMIIAYYNLLPAWNLSLATPTRHTSAFGNYVLEPYHFHGNYFPGGGYGYMWPGGVNEDPYHLMAKYYELHGLEASELDSPSLDTVISEITAGYPYSLCNGLTSAGHIIVINGVSDKQGTLICNDPYGNKNSGSYPTPNGKDVQYDWPGYNNGHQNLNEAYWGVSVRYTPPAESDSIVDDLQFTADSAGSHGFVLNNAKPASMSLWLDRNTGYDGHEWYTYTRDSDTCTAVWRPLLKSAGEYGLFAYIGNGNAKAARYEIFHGGDSTTVVLNQALYSNSWAPLGAYSFDAGDGGYVKLGDGSDSVGEILTFDAIKWSYRSATLVESVQPPIPHNIVLNQNYPNPFNPSTAITYSIPKGGYVSVDVYNALGEKVSSLVQRNELAGTYTLDFDGSRLPSGVYFYTLKWGNYMSVKKMLILK